MNPVKTYKEFLNENKKPVNESAMGDLALTALATILAAGTAVVVKYAGMALLTSFVNGISNIGSRIKSIVAPSKLDKFAKIIENDAKFNRDFLDHLEKEGGHKKIWIWGFFAKEVTELPSFQEKFTAFVEENKISDADAKILLDEIQKAIVQTMRNDAEYVVDNIKKKFPEVKTQ
jgi:hypothetical protein